MREVIRDKYNGRLLYDQTVATFCEALQWVAGLSPEKSQALRRGTLQIAEDFSMQRSVDKALTYYKKLYSQAVVTRSQEYEQWQHMHNLVKTEWDIIKGMAGATGAVLTELVSPDLTTK